MYRDSPHKDSSARMCVHVQIIFVEQVVKRKVTIRNPLGQEGIKGKWYRRGQIRCYEGEKIRSSRQKNK